MPLVMSSVNLHNLFKKIKSYVSMISKYSREFIQNSVGYKYVPPTLLTCFILPIAHLKSTPTYTPQEGKGPSIAGTQSLAPSRQLRSTLKKKMANKATEKL
jgi:hypothetical protein